MDLILEFYQDVYYSFPYKPPKLLLSKISNFLVKKLFQVLMMVLRVLFDVYKIKNQFKVFQINIAFLILLL